MKEPIPDSNASYERVKPGEPTYEFIQGAKRHGIWVCDSVDHNEDYGCSNPDCFKHDPPGTRWSRQER